MTFETKKIIDFCVPIFCHQFYHLDNDVVATVVELEKVNSYFGNSGASLDSKTVAAALY